MEEPLADLRDFKRPSLDGPIEPLKHPGELYIDQQSLMRAQVSPKNKYLGARKAQV